MRSIYRKYLTTIGLVWAGCFVLFLFVYMLVLSPQEKSEREVEKRLAETKQMYSSILKMVQKETKIRLDEQMERLRDRLGNFVTDFGSSAALTFDISQIANEQKLASFGIRTGDKGRSSAIPGCNYICENRVDISFTAGFNQFATFLNVLERHRPAVFVDGCTITRSDRDGSGHKVSMNLAVFARKQQGT